MLDQVYGAIADPTRRAILGILAEGEANVGSLAERFPISLNGVSKHVKVLERAGLVERTVQGREHRLRLNAEPLREASMWLEHYRTFWDTRLEALEAFLLKRGPRRGWAMTVTDEAAPVLVVRRQWRCRGSGCSRRGSIRRAWRTGCGRWNVTHATVTVDPRVGGGFRIVMEGRPDGGVEHHGEYLAIEPPSLLSFTWISRDTDHKPTVVTIEFHERGTGTELVLTHRRLPPKAIEGHRKGWTDVVRLLDEALTQG